MGWIGNHCLECRWCDGSVVEDGIRYARCIRDDGFDVSGGLVSSLTRQDCWEERMGDRCGNCVWMKTNAEGGFWCGNEESTRLGTIVSDGDVCDQWDGSDKEKDVSGGLARRCGNCDWVRNEAGKYFRCGNNSSPEACNLVVEGDVCDHWSGSETVEKTSNDSNNLELGRDRYVPTKNKGRCEECVLFKPNKILRGGECQYTLKPVEKSGSCGCFIPNDGDADEMHLCKHCIVGVRKSDETWRCGDDGLYYRGTERCTRMVPKCGETMQVCWTCAFRDADSCLCGKGTVRPNGTCEKWNSGPIGVDAFSGGYGPSDRGTILGEAFSIVNGKRQDAYGNPEDSFSTIAALWNGWLTARYGAEFELGRHEVGIMMALMKMARIAGGSDRDSYRDCAGYIGLAADMANAVDREKE